MTSPVPPSTAAQRPSPPSRPSTPHPRTGRCYEYPCFPYPNFEKKIQTITGLIYLLGAQLNPGAPSSERALSLIQRVHSEFGDLAAIIERVSAEYKNYMSWSYDRSWVRFTKLVGFAYANPTFLEKILKVAELMQQLQTQLQFGNDLRLDQQVLSIQTIRQEFQNLATFIGGIKEAYRGDMVGMYTASWEEFAAVAESLTGRALEPIIIASNPAASS